MVEFEAYLLHPIAFASSTASMDLSEVELEVVGVGLPKCWTIVDDTALAPRR